MERCRPWTRSRGEDWSQPRSCGLWQDVTALPVERRRRGYEATEATPTADHSGNHLGLESVALLR